MSNIITFYDIPSTVPGKAWSPNTWKTRFSLNFKGLPYKTVWLEYPEIEEFSKKNGIPPTDLKPDGTPLYTFPAIHDPSTGKWIADSAIIAEYLDKQYPDTPKLYPEGTDEAQKAFYGALLGKLTPLWQFALPATNRVLNPKSEAYFRPTRQAISGGATMEQVDPSPGEARTKALGDLKNAFADVDTLFEKKPYFLGTQISFADFILGAFLIWFKRTLGEDGDDWKEVKTWQEGRWEKFLNGLEKYQTIPE